MLKQNRERLEKELCKLSNLYSTSLGIFPSVDKADLLFWHMEAHMQSKAPET